MPSIVQHAPNFHSKDAEKIAADLFGVTGHCKTLPSERDQNFRLISNEGGDFVLKVANALESREVLDFQNQVMDRLVAASHMQIDGVASSPEVRRTLGDETITTIEGRDGQTHFVRLLTYLPGKPLAMVKPHDADLLTSLGRFFGRVDHTLEGFDHASAHREFHWDLLHASRVVSYP